VRPVAAPGGGLQLQCGALESQAMFTDSTGTDCVDEERHPNTKGIEMHRVVSPLKTMEKPRESLRRRA
jgi:hypothetical protein